MNKDGRFFGVALYAITLSINAVLISFLVVLLAGIRMGPGERWIGLALSWWTGLPALAALALGGAVTYSRYRAATSLVQSTSVYLTTLIVATFLGLLVAFLIGELHA